MRILSFVALCACGSSSSSPDISGNYRSASVTVAFASASLEQATFIFNEPNLYLSANAEGASLVADQTVVTQTKTTLLSMDMFGGVKKETLLLDGGQGELRTVSSDGLTQVAFVLEITGGSSRADGQVINGSATGTFTADTTVNGVPGKRATGEMSITFSGSSSR